MSIEEFVGCVVFAIAMGLIVRLWVMPNDDR